MLLVVLSPIWFTLLALLILHFCLRNEIFWIKCKNCGSRKKKIKGEYWGFGEYSYRVYCAECGCQLDYNFAIPEDEYRQLIKRYKEKGIEVEE